MVSPTKADIRATIAFCPEAQFGFRGIKSDYKSGLWIDFSEPVGLQSGGKLEDALRFYDDAGRALDCIEETQLLKMQGYVGYSKLDSGDVLGRWTFRCKELTDTVRVELNSEALISYEPSGSLAYPCASLTIQQSFAWKTLTPVDGCFLTAPGG